MEIRDYVRGFNEGFLIVRSGRDIPKVEISDATKLTLEYYNGLRDGEQEYRRELLKRIKERSRRKRNRDR